MEVQTPSISTKAVLQIIEEARDAELCRNIDLSRMALEPIWPDINKAPDYRMLPANLHAELLRLSGFLLVFCGKSQNKPKYQARGKDLLTAAIEIFESLGEQDKAAEANVMLALSYWYCGEAEECDAILSSIEETFQGNELHPVYLQIRVNRLMVLYRNEQYEEALKIIQALIVPMEFCHDVRLLAMYHNQAGIVFQKLKKSDKAIFHVNEAVRTARSANNYRFVGLNLNNLANFYRELRYFDQAHLCADESIKIFESLADVGWIPHALDTKALILLDEGQPRDALATISTALQMFRNSEDMSGCVESLWTKCLCLLKLDQDAEAFATFAELHQLAATRIGQTATTKYVSLFAEHVHCLTGLPLADEVAYFKKTRIQRALVASKGHIGAAAESLGIRSHQTLSNILKNQFPELYNELGIRRRERGSRNGTSPEKPSAAVDAERDIIAVTGSDDFKFPHGVRAGSVNVYLCNADLLEPLGIEADSLVAVRPRKIYEPGTPIVFKNNHMYGAARLQYQDMTRLLFVEIDDVPTPISIPGLQILGEAIAFYPAEWLPEDDGPVRFVRMPPGPSG